MCEERKDRPIGNLPTKGPYGWPLQDPEGRKEEEPEKRTGSCAEVLANGGASRPGEPEKGTTAGRTARPDGSSHPGAVEAEGASREAAEEKVTKAREEVRVWALEAMQAKEARGRMSGLARALAVVLMGAGVAWWWYNEHQGILGACQKRLAGETKTIHLPGGATMEMVRCPPGMFSMGSTNGWDDEKPLHNVTLTKGFWMAKTEVTQGQWEKVMGTTVQQQRDKVDTSWSLAGEGEDYPIQGHSQLPHQGLRLSPRGPPGLKGRPAWQRGAEERAE